MEENFEKKTANGATALGLPLADLLGKEAKAYFRGDDGDAGADGRRATEALRGVGFTDREIWDIASSA